MIHHDQMYVATESFVDATGISYYKDTTRVMGSVVAKNKWEHLFKPMEVSHPPVEQATKAPGEKRGSRKPKAKAKPKPKAKPKAASEPAEKPKAAPAHSTGLSMGSFAQVESATAAPGEKRGEKP